MEWWWSQTVPYTADGVIDWGKLEEGIPAADADDEFDCEIKKLDFGKPLPSNIHPLLLPQPQQRLLHRRTQVQLREMPRGRGAGKPHAKEVDACRRTTDNGECQP